MKTQRSRKQNVFKRKGFPGGSDSKESVFSAGDPGSIPGLGRTPGEGNHLLTPVFLPGESHGQRSLVGYSLWDRKESDVTEHQPYYCCVELQTSVIKIQIFAIAHVFTFSRTFISSHSF